MSVALERAPLRRSRRANEAVGSTTRLIQLGLTSFASRAVDSGVGGLSGDLPGGQYRLPDDGAPLRRRLRPGSAGPEARGQRPQGRPAAGGGGRRRALRRSAGGSHGGRQRG